MQTVRFDKKLFTPAQAKKWLKAHGFSSGQFEPASNEAMTITAEAHIPSHEEIRDLIDKALRSKYPSQDDYYSHRFLVHKIWDDKVLLCKGYYSKMTEDPNWALIDYDVSDGGDDGVPSVTLGDLVPVTIQAVPKDGGDGIIIDEAGRRNANSDAAKINQAIRALLATLNDDDLEEDTISVLNAKMLAPINGEGDFQDFGEAKYTDKPWDGSKSRFSIEQLLKSVPRAIAAWAKSKAGDGEVTKDNLHLPYKEPDGTISLGGARNALARANQVKGVPSDVMGRARAELQRALAAGKKALGKSDEGQEPDQKDTITEAWNSLPGETFTEAFGSALSEAEIDYDKLILKNVVVLGPTSTNGRKYPVETQKSALSLFEGIRAYVNHPKLNEMSEPRDMRDLIGEHKNLRMVGDKTVSDLYLIDNAVVRDVVLPLAESKPHLAGNSIVARGRMVKEKDGTHKVEQILAARSIDIVTEPATTNSLFTEGKQFSSEEEEMDLKTLTMETLKKERPDLFEAVTTALQAEIESKTQKEAESKALKDKVTALENRVTELEAGIVERDKKITTHELEAAKAQKDSLIEGLFKAAKIPDRVKYAEKDGVKAINPHFRSLMERCQDEPEMKELVRTWEETYRQGPISEEKRLDFGENGKVSEAALDQLYRAVG